jgi:hypothetical protein
MNVERKRSCSIALGRARLSVPLAAPIAGALPNPAAFNDPCKATPLPVRVPLLSAGSITNPDMALTDAIQGQEVVLNVPLTAPDRGS